jgi:hypothetical protein
MHWVPALPASRGKSPAVKAVMGERCPRWLSPMGTVVICIRGAKRLAAGEPDCSTDQLSQRLSRPVESTPSAEG